MEQLEDALHAETLKLSPEITKKLDAIWLDGQLVPWDAATDHLLAHTMHYGGGAFEGIRAYQRGDGRTMIFRLREHIDRLLAKQAIQQLKMRGAFEAGAPVSF